jgi:protein-disulfide isomerase
LGDTILSKTSDRFIDFATVTVAILAVLVAGESVWSRFTAPPGASDVDREIENWEEYASAGRWLGPTNAPVVIVSFGDYECPFCQIMEKRLTALRQTYPRDVAVVHRHFPLPMHEHAYQAARLAECGARQDRFEAVHGILYRRSDLGAIEPADLAVEADIDDVPVFVECASDTAQVSRIERDLDVAEELALRGTPTLIVNGLLLATNPDSAGLFDMVRERLDEPR